MPQPNRPLSPHLQVYRWQITMLLSILHRATGVALSTGIVLLVGWLLAAAAGPEAYTRLREVLGSVPGLVIVGGIVYSLAFHLCNGIRHLFWDAGLGFEKHEYYATGWTVVVASVLITTGVFALAYGVLAGASV